MTIPSSVEVTRTCQTTAPDSFTTAALLGALEGAWVAIRSHHPDVPAAIIVVGSGSTSAKSSDLKYGHYATLRWQLGEHLLPEVLVSGEGLHRTPVEVLSTLLHEATHALADRRGIQDTSRQGRWHNQRFATLAGELGLIAEKDPHIGWSPCTLAEHTQRRYAGVLTALTAAMRAYRHPEDGIERTRTNNNNGHVLTCDCPRRIRVSVKVADEGPIHCGICHSVFLTEEQRELGVDPRPRPDVYDPTGAYHDGMPTYPYRLAPRGLATRRQLRRLDLRPAGQPIAAQILWRQGTRVAYLFRIDLAQPKRSPTAAQLGALDKAMQARRTCPTCTQVKDYYIPRRLGHCADCNRGGVR